MVKGISKQVIVVKSLDPDLFEQAIFILKDGHKGVSDEMLLKEANRILSRQSERVQENFWIGAAIWGMAGAFATGLIWFLTAIV